MMLEWVPTSTYLNLNSKGPPISLSGLLEQTEQKPHRLGWLNNRNVCFSRSGAWKSEVKVLAELVSFEASLLGLSTTSAFSGRPHTAFASCLCEDFH